MSILIDKNTRVITQGITGKTGQFHTRMCRDYANGKNCFVAGVNPKKAGEEFEGIPIYATVKDAKAQTGANHEARAALMHQVGGLIQAKEQAVGDIERRLVHCRLGVDRWLALIHRRFHGIKISQCLAVRQDVS